MDTLRMPRFRVVTSNHLDEKTPHHRKSSSIQRTPDARFLAADG